MPTPPLLVALALLAGEPADMKAIEQVYVEGQTLTEQKEYAKAAKAFERILDMVPESEGNRALRESVMLNVIDSYLSAYRNSVDASGQRDRRHLVDAKQAEQRYREDFERTHGSRGVLLPEVVNSFAELDRTLQGELPLLPLALVLGDAADPKVEEAYAAGQALYEREDYASAAKAFEHVLELTPDSEENRALREIVALSVVQAHRSAYGAPDDFGEKDVDHLLDALAFRDRLTSKLPEGIPLSDALQRAFEGVEHEVRLHEEMVLGPCLQPPPPPCLEPILPKRGCGGTNDPLVAAALLLPLGLRRRDVFHRIANTLPADVAARLRSKLDDEP